MNLTDTIRDLCVVPAPPGYETPAAEKLTELIAPFTDEAWTDALGNLIAVRGCGRPGAKKLVFTAHMDEIGFIVMGHENGFLSIEKLGGTDTRPLPGSEMRVLSKEPLFGVVSTMPPHALEKSEMDKFLPTDKLFVDIGFGQEKAKELVPLGTPVVYASGCQTLGDDMLIGKAMDDRAGAAVIIKAFENLRGKKLGADLYALFTSQEELGCRGAGPGVFSIRPDYCVAVDVSPAHTPGDSRERRVKMGDGAAIGVGPNANRRLSESIISLAEDKCIPYQYEVLPGKSGTDAWAIQISREGVATALVSLPVKYMHSPQEMIRMSDAEAAISLLTELALAAGEVL